MKNFFNTKRSRSNQAGFTLIELLVVIAIIGLLSSVILASLNGARKKGRDARRQADLKQLQVALELYFNNTGQYPVPGTNPTTNAAQFIASPGLGQLVTDGDIPALPYDPTNSGTNLYYYKTTANGSGYCLGTFMETTPTPISSCNVVSLGLASAPTGNYVVGP